MRTLMTLMTRSCPRDHFRAARVVSAMAALAFLGLLAALPARREAQCTLSGSGSLVSFEPRPPGVSRPISLSSGYNSNLALYQSGGSGPDRAPDRKSTTLNYTHDKQ